MRKLTTLLASAAFAFTAVAPAGAQDWRRDGYGRSYEYGCDRGDYRCRRDHDRGYRDGYRRGDYYGYGGNRYGSDRYGYGYDYDHRRDDDDDDDAIVAGVVGLVLGAVLASAVTANQHDGNGYSNGYRRNDRCTRQERRWDRSAQRYVYVDVPC